MPKLVLPTRTLQVIQSALPRPNPPFAQNPAYHQQPIAPIHLSSFVVIQPGSSGNPPKAAYLNPMGQDMEILEIKFEAQAGPGGPTTSIFGGTIWCAFVMGGIKLTNGAIPIWGFGRAENLAAEQKIDTTNSIIFNAYTWRLPRPLFVPAGTVLAPALNHTGFVNLPISVRVSYSARTVTKKPKKIYVPWVANYLSKAFNPVETADTDQSQELDLINDSSGFTGGAQVFHLQRFTGRTLWRDNAGNLGENLPEFGAQNLTMRMVDSYGRPIARTYMPFGSVFSSLTRSWELESVGAELDPGAFYRVFLKNSGYTPSVANRIQAQASVSMVGWREMKP